ncbi:MULTISPECIES: hypothetical protein [unclassified Methylobacterium]|uniref:hypothetical protein n=1 Tax=unclassified Methylobacterium TaxID=2615210 RepID=UPI0011C1F7AB|nr:MULTISPECIES: hypothetical protein [unclassified Methylobacterium]QEE39825.1 hypothetical protein FVA80_13550 [Methylobacterium sp. WL1]TXN57331.1 hypothetical protein FV241_11760 [Methylobacterium sp. WL2]
MTRAAAAVLALMLATPAAAACRTVPETIAVLRAPLPGHAFVGEVPAAVGPAVAAWLEFEGLPVAGATRFVHVAGDRGIALIPVDGDRVCDGAPAFQLIGDKARELAAFIRRFRELRGFGPEYAA